MMHKDVSGVHCMHFCTDNHMEQGGQGQMISAPAATHLATKRNIVPLYGLSSNEI
jgi:hypothetical protein